MKTGAGKITAACEPSDRSDSAEADSQPRLPDSLVQWPGFLLAWVADMGNTVYSSALGTLGIKPQHLAILTLLASDGPMVQARLGDRLTIVKPIIVELVNELEAMMLVQRQPHPTDKRAFDIHLLEAGRKRIRDAETISQHVTDEFFSSLSEDERQHLTDMLMRLAMDNNRKKQ